LVVFVVQQRQFVGVVGELIANHIRFLTKRHCRLVLNLFVERWALSIFVVKLFHLTGIVVAQHGALSQLVGVSVLLLTRQHPPVEKLFVVVVESSVLLDGRGQVFVALIRNVAARFFELLVDDVVFLAVHCN